MSKVAVPVSEGTLGVLATDSRAEFEVTTDGVGVVGHAGGALHGVARCLFVCGASAAQNTDAAAFLAVAGPGWPGQSGVWTDSGWSESSVDAGGSMSSLVRAQLASRRRACWEGDPGSAV